LIVSLTLHGCVAFTLKGRLNNKSNQAISERTPPQ